MCQRAARLTRKYRTVVLMVSSLAKRSSGGVRPAASHTTANSNACLISSWLILNGKGCCLDPRRILCRLCGILSAFAAMQAAVPRTINHTSFHAECTALCTCVLATTSRVSDSGTACELTMLQLSQRVWCCPGTGADPDDLITRCATSCRCGMHYCTCDFPAYA